MNKDIMRSLGLSNMVDLVEKGKCPFCEKTINTDEFKDEKSKKEFGISGMCQLCQDKFFE